MKLFFCGDVFFDKSIDFRFSRKLEDIIRGSDYSCFNAEGPVYVEGLMKSDKRGSHLLNARSLPRIMGTFGFNIVSLANNHIMDYGKDGLTNTINLMNKEGIKVVGAGMDEDQAYRYLLLEGNEKVGIISVAEKQFGACIADNPGFAWMYKRNVYTQIKKAKLECDLVIVLCHCGAEEINIPLPEVRELYRLFIDYGADIVIGNHPHVIQGYEEYNGKRIFYSLGNFIWDREGQMSESTSLGVCVDIKDDGSVVYDTIEITYKNGCLNISEEKEIFNTAIRDLNDKEIYIKRINDFCVEYYHKYLKFYYGQVIGFDINDKNKQNEFIDHRLVGDQVRWDDLMVYHNAAIETNRWIAERAIVYIKVL